MERSTKRILSPAIVSVTIILLTMMTLILESANVYAGRGADLLPYGSVWVTEKNLRENGLICGNQKCGAVAKKLRDLFQCRGCFGYICRKCLQLEEREKINEEATYTAKCCNGRSLIRKASIENLIESTKNKSANDEPRFYAYCKNGTCTWHYNLLDDDWQQVWENHQQTCQQAPISDCHFCGQRYYQRDKENHFANKCPKRNVTCHICQEVLPVDEFNENHTIKCKINTARLKASSVFSFDEHSEFYPLASSIIRSVETTGEELIKIKQAVQQSWDTQYSRILQTFSDPDLISSQTLEIGASDIENDIKLHQSFLGVSDTFTLDSSSAEAQQRLLVSVYPADLTRAANATTYKNLYTADVWLLDTSGNSDQWSGKISDDITVTFILPSRANNTTHKKIRVTPSQFTKSVPTANTQKIRSVNPSSHPTFKLGNLQTSGRLEDITYWLHHRTQGNDHFKVAISPRHPIQKRRSIRQDLSLTKILEKIDNNCLHLNVPTRVFQQPSLSASDNLLYGCESKSGLWFNVEDERWSIFVGFLNGQATLALKLESDSYKKKLKSIEFSFIHPITHQSLVWPESMSIIDLRSRENFSTVVKDMGYALPFPDDLFFRAVQEGYVQNDRILVEMSVSLKSNTMALSIEEDTESTAAQSHHTTHERLKLAETQIATMTDQLKSLQLGERYSKGLTEGHITDHNSYLEWKVPYLQGYSPRYHFFSPTFKHNNITYQIEVTPNPRSHNNSKGILRAHPSEDGSNVPYFRPLSAHKFQIFNHENNGWSTWEYNYDQNAGGPLTRNKRWAEIRSTGLHNIFTVSQKHFPQQKGLHVHITLSGRAESRSSTQRPADEHTRLLNN
ncbi:hypothetical protein [Parendozoicomonas sp. Alg238-R29]|uniref:hypothetical protein n=1 Tax=Parendozoicomonas sp. Alg238-R29 TaxID=2993446 RepID=UPI00248EE62D|nr:hypothetical protein [Parendozoicomonas sp. Alg238-R29]